jgi:iron complex transport system substrate-binding protein
MKFSWLLWLLPLTLLGLVVYVGIAALHNDVRPPAKAPTVVDGSASGFPRTLIQEGGREVVIKARPTRVVPSDCGPADMLAALIEPGRMAALPGPVDTWGGATDFYAAHPEIPRFQNFNSETVFSFKPDLVLFTTYRDAAIATYLETHGVTVVRFDNFKTFNGIRGAMLAIGHALGEDEKTKVVVDDFDRRVKAIETALAGRKKPRVIGYSNYGTGFVIGANESQDEVLRRAGAINAAVEMNLAGHSNFTFEQMLKANPDWIVTFGDDGLNSQQAQFLLNEPTLAGMEAIKQRHIAVVPDRYYSAISQYIVNAVEILARQLHPDAFPATTPSAAPKEKDVSKTESSGQAP